MKLEKITPIENNNQRVLTTAQIAEAYGTNVQAISNNYNRNKPRYKAGKHYYLLKGALLQDFRAIHQIDELPSNVGKLYLWTEAGALLHAKSLNTNKAWDVYMYLVDFYFRTKSALAEELQKSLDEAHGDIALLLDRIGYLKHSTTVAVGEQEQLRLAARLNILTLFGGKHTVSYRLYSRRVYRMLWYAYRKHFRLDSYRNTPEYRFSEGMEFIRAWEPGKWTRKAIKSIEKDFYNFLETFFDDVDRDGYKKLLADCPAIVEEFLT
jgi:virulence-associated protein VapD